MCSKGLFSFSLARVGGAMDSFQAVSNSSIDSWIEKGGEVLPGTLQELKDAGRSEGPATAGPSDGAASVPGEAVSVTRLAQITKGSSKPVPLACGVDTLDLGLYITWGRRWDDLMSLLDLAKEQAAGTDGIPLVDGTFLMLPGGKPPAYRWHLQWPEFHLYLGRSPEPQQKTPNGYASINAKTLWSMGVPGAVEFVSRRIKMLEGELQSIKPSRCDLAADFRLSGPLELPFLLDHRVPQHVQHSHNMTGSSLETFYHGAKKSPIQLRIYDKALEVFKGGTKLWFYDLWGATPADQVWRVEYQLRRESLKQFGINTVEDLIEKSGGLWQYLTEDWFSLRERDDSNTSRRTVLPWWEVVQSCAEQFGPSMKLYRSLETVGADSAWYVSHCAGCLVGYAARERLMSFEEAAASIMRRMSTYFEQHDFQSKLSVKSIQLGYSGSSESADVDVETSETEFGS